MIRPKYITVPAPCGDIRGRILPSGIEEYLGIPYARADRFCPPRPISWSGRRDCMEYGPCAPQPDVLGEKPVDRDFSIQGDEDCLNLNIWAQPGTVSRGLPVVVYVHGGGFQVGSNSEPATNGAAFIQKEPLIFVSVNYRLGALGFLQTGDRLGDKYRDSGNCGVLDVMAAIEWVYKNIEAFGGNPSRIHLLGISAGAKMIASLLTLPKVQKMCYGIILESGAMQSFRSKKTAEYVADRFEQVLKRRYESEHGVDTWDESYMLTLPMKQLMEAQAELCDAPGSTCWFGPVLDDRTFHSGWITGWNYGKAWKGKAIIGSCAREMCFMAERADFENRKEEILENLFGDHAPSVQARFEQLEGLRKRGSENWVRVMSDYMYRSHSDRLAAKLAGDGSTVWTYSFQYGAASHGMGFHYLMHQLTEPGETEEPEDMLIRRKVAREMRGMIKRFICSGTPEEPHRWPPYNRNSGYVKMVFDAVPHTESRPLDSLDGFPVMSYTKEIES